MIPKRKVESKPDSTFTWQGRSGSRPISAKIAQKGETTPISEPTLASHPLRKHELTLDFPELVITAGTIGPATLGSVLALTGHIREAGILIPAVGLQVLFTFYGVIRERDREKLSSLTE